MKKILSVLCIALAIAGCDRTDENTIKIGAVLPMTGSNASFGASLRAGMETAVKDKSNTKYKYKIIFEDGQTSAAKSVSAAQKLVSANNVRVLMSTTTGIGRAIAPVAESANVLNLSATYETENAEPMGKTTFFQGSSIESLHNAALYAIKKNKVKSVVLISANVGVSCPGSKVLGEKLTKAGVKTSVECFNPGERDFKFITDKYKDVDAYYISAFPPETDIILRHLYSNGIERSKIYGQGLDVVQDRSLIENVNVVSQKYGTPEFIDRIDTEYKLKHQHLTSVAYDLVLLAIDAFEAVGPDNMDGVYEYIRTHATRDCMSGTCKLLPNGFIVNEAEWRTYKNGKPIVFEK